MTRNTITYEVTTEPTLEPVTLQTFKDSLRETTCDFDEELTRLLTTARRQVENDTHRKLFTQTVKMYLDRFPTGDSLEIRLAPVSAVASVTYVDEDRATQTFAASNYDTDFVTTPPRIVLTEASDGWPDTEPGYPRAVTVEMTAGYATRALIPAEATLAVLEWAKAAWAGCDDPAAGGVYRNLISSLRWTEYHIV